MNQFVSKRKLAAALLCGMVAVLLSACGFLINQHLHGENLLKLSDYELYEAVYFQNLDLVESFPDEETALSQIDPARRVVYILSIYDMEIQNGGLCQFFVNSSRSLAPYVQECLEAVGAQEHLALYSGFITDNQIDVRDLESFAISDIEEYDRQFERYDFDSFDDAFIELAPLWQYIAAYIRANIQAF